MPERTLQRRSCQAPESNVNWHNNEERRNTTNTVTNAAPCSLGLRGYSAASFPLWVRGGLGGVPLTFSVHALRNL